MFTKQHHKNDTELSIEYWKVKQQNGIPIINWKVLRKCHAYKQKKRQCILCLNEKYEIAFYKRDSLLNKRTEILGTCRHRNKYKIKILKPKHTNVTKTPCVKAQQKHPDVHFSDSTNKKLCPLKGQCLTESIVCQANITVNILGYKEKVYLGISEATFKVSCGNHKKLFTKQHHKNDTELSIEYWKVKQQNGIPIINWKVLRKCHAYDQKKKQCIFCLNGKYEIASYKRDSLLNKRTEILGTCRHRNKYKIKNCRSKDGGHISIS